MSEETRYHYIIEKKPENNEIAQFKRGRSKHGSQHMLCERCYMRIPIRRKVRHLADECRGAK
ncbi:MAG: hypothetical protein NVS9B4_00380 [Candidatus Acidiferrum sp.]